MVHLNNCPGLYEEGMVEALDDCSSQWGLCCDLNDAFVRSLGRAEQKMITVHIRGFGKKVLQLESVQADVMRCICKESNMLLMLSLCSVFIFYEGDLVEKPNTTSKDTVLRLDGGANSRCCRGLLPELERLIGKRVTMALPDGNYTLLVTEVMGKTLRGVSGDTIVTMRIDCIDMLEMPLSH